MGRCMLGGLLIFVAMSLGTESCGFAPSTPSDVDAAADGIGRRHDRRWPWAGTDPVAAPWHCGELELGRLRRVRYDLHRREGHVDAAGGDLLQESAADRLLLGRDRWIHLEQRDPSERQPRRHGVGRGVGQWDRVHADHHRGDTAVLHDPDVGGCSQRARPNGSPRGRRRPSPTSLRCPSSTHPRATAPMLARSRTRPGPTTGSSWSRVRERSGPSRAASSTTARASWWTGCTGSVSRPAHRKHATRITPSGRKR